MIPAGVRSKTSRTARSIRTILNGASTGEIKAEAIKLGFRSLRMSAVKHFMDGMVPIDEVTGNTAVDEL